MDFALCASTPPFSTVPPIVRRYMMISRPVTDRASSLTERASGGAVRLIRMCVENRIYLASSVG